MGVLGSLGQQILSFVFPAPCLECGHVEPGPSPPLGLCLPCRGRLRPAPRVACPGCGRRLEAAKVPAGYLCAACRARPPAWRRLLVGWSYEPPIEPVIHGLKFGRLDYLGEHLAGALFERFRRELGEVETVVPVPLHWRRELLRGYNQAERIARPLARRLGRPLRRAIRRCRATPPQTDLERQARLRSVRDAFRPRFRPRVEGRRVVLVDDVVTTGATLDAAARTLLRAGAATVLALAATRTPEPG